MDTHETYASDETMTMSIEENNEAETKYNDEVEQLQKAEHLAACAITGAMYRS